MLEIPEIVQLASAFYGSATLFAALDCGIFGAIEECVGSATLAGLADRLRLSRHCLRLLWD